MKPAASSEASFVAGGTSWVVIVALYLAGLGAAAQYGKVSVAFADLGQVYPGVGPSLGFAVSLVGAVGIALGVVAGLVVARIRYRRALLWALWSGAALSAAQATLPPFGWFLASRVAEGASHLAIVVAAPTLIAQLAAERHRAAALTLWSTFFGVAFALLAWGGLPLVARTGVGPLFGAHAVWMAAMALVLTALLPRREDPAPAASLSAGDVLRAHLAIYASARIGAAGWGWLFYTFCFVGLLTLLPPRVSPDLRAAVLGILPLVSIAASMTLGIWLLRRYGAVVVTVAGFLVSAAAASLLVLATATLTPGFLSVLVVLACGLGLVQGASFAAVPQLNATAVDRARANGAIAQMGNAGNAAGTPILAAAVAAFGVGALFGVLAAMLLSGAAAHLWMARRRRTAAVAGVS